MTEPNAPHVGDRPAPSPRSGDAEAAPAGSTTPPSRAERPAAERPAVKRPAIDGPRPEQPRPDGPRSGGPRPEQPVRSWRGPVAAIVLVAVLAAIAGYGAAAFWQQRKHAQHATAADLSGVGQDLSVAVASMRTAGYEIKPQDVEKWLRDPAAYGSRLRLHVLSADGGTVTVAGYETWSFPDTVLHLTHTTRRCAQVSLAAGVRAPVTSRPTTCPDGIAADAPGAQAEMANGQLASTAEKARIRRTEGGSADKPFPLAGPTRPVGDLRQASVALMCAAGTTNIGTSTGYVDGRAIPIRLCSVDDLPSSSETSTPGNRFFIDGADGHAVVNARVSGAIAALVADAARHGLHLSANSSFRSMAQQQDTCDHDLSQGCQHGEYTYVAQPGYSNHQAGAAVDFTGTSVAGKDVCDATRAKDPKSRVWRFLNNQALTYGFKQYAPESWHWDVMAGADRCSPL